MAMWTVRTEHAPDFPYIHPKIYWYHPADKKTTPVQRITADLRKSVVMRIDAHLTQKVKQRGAPGSRQGLNYQ